MQRGLYYQIGVFALLLGISLLFFQNCSSSPSEPAPAAFVPQTELEDQIVVALHASGSAAQDICERDSSYLCEVRSYGKSVETGSASRVECFGGTCVDVLRLAFNTSAQIASCFGCDSDEVRERYEYEDIHCMNRSLPAGRTLPVRAPGMDVQQALEAVKAKCRALADVK